ncbi:MAG: hypothetical protein IT578_04540 [Verrucomicrobiae bacterium]|nr:hypothetical protein [Verrucomicrobiae bacterium]
MRFIPARLVFVFLVLTAGAGSSFARVFSLRPSGSVLEDPSALGGKAVYSGRFIVNGAPCVLRLIQLPDTPELAMRRLEGALGGGLAWGRTRGATVTGSWADGNAHRRLLLIPGGVGGGSLIFALDARAAPGKPPRWPSGLPEVSPAQRADWVIEHPEAGFLLASATVENAVIDALMETCKARFEEDGWQVHSGPSGGERRGPNSGFALFTKKGKACWVQARSGPSPQQAAVLFLIKADSSAPFLPP